MDGKDSVFKKSIKGSLRNISSEHVYSKTLNKESCFCFQYGKKKRINKLNCVWTIFLFNMSCKVTLLDVG